MSEGGAVIKYESNDAPDLIYLQDAGRSRVFCVARCKETLEAFLLTCFKIVGCAADGYNHCIEVHPIIAEWLKIVQEPVVTVVSRKIEKTFVGQKSGAYGNFTQVRQWVLQDKCADLLKKNVGNVASDALAKVKTVLHYIIPTSAYLKETNGGENLKFVQFFDLGTGLGNVNSTVSFNQTMFKREGNTADLHAMHSVRILLHSGNSTKYNGHNDPYDIDYTSLNKEVVQQRWRDAPKTFNTYFCQAIDNDFESFLKATSARNFKQYTGDSTLNIVYTSTDAYFNYPEQREIMFPADRILNMSLQEFEGEGSPKNEKRSDAIWACVDKMRALPTNSLVSYERQFDNMHSVMHNYAQHDGAPTTVIQLVLFPVNVVSNIEQLTAAEKEYRLVLPYAKPVTISIENDSDNITIIDGEYAQNFKSIPGKVPNDGYRTWELLDAGLFPRSNGSGDIKPVFALIVPGLINQQIITIDGKYRIRRVDMKESLNNTGDMIKSLQTFENLLRIRYVSSIGLAKAKGTGAPTENISNENRAKILLKFQIWIDIRLFYLAYTFNEVSDAKKKWTMLQIEVLMKIHALLELTPDADESGERKTETAKDTYLVRDVLTKFAEMQYLGLAARDIADPTWLSDISSSPKEQKEFMETYAKQISDFSEVQCNGTQQYESYFTAAFDEFVANYTAEMKPQNMLEFCMTIPDTDTVLDEIFTSFPSYEIFAIGQKPEPPEFITNQTDPNIKKIVNVFTGGIINPSDQASRTLCTYKELQPSRTYASQTLVMQLPGTCKSAASGDIFIRATVMTLEGENNLNDLLPFAKTPNFAQFVSANYTTKRGDISTTENHVVQYQWLDDGGTTRSLTTETTVPSTTINEDLPSIVTRAFKTTEFMDIVKHWASAESFVLPQTKTWLQSLVGFYPGAAAEVTFSIVSEDGLETYTKDEYFGEFEDLVLNYFDPATNNDTRKKLRTLPFHDKLTEKKKIFLIKGAAFMDIMHYPHFTEIMQKKLYEHAMNGASMDESVDASASGGGGSSDGVSAEASFTDSSFLDYTQSCMSDAVHAELPPTALLDFSARFNREMEPHVVSELLDREHPLRSLTSGAFCAKVFSDFPTLSARARHEWEPWVAAQHAAALAV